MTRSWSEMDYSRFGAACMSFSAEREAGDSGREN